MNLHDIVRGAVTTVARDKPCKIYRATGKQVRSERGDTVPVYAAPKDIKAQFQSVSADVLQHFEKVNVTTSTRRVYLYADYDPAARPWAMWRPLGRSGDLIQDDLECWWLITDVLEDFTHEGWASVLAVMQQTPISMQVEDADDGSDDTEAP